ncbi:sensor histidine kinase [Actinoplanes sp. G11-F43]|uniref:sensor histidine kinase n=1 Tax=Actinoplanes sp. G11-F43 TaxID=3424130 RepID=UPI003D329F4B
MRRRSGPGARRSLITLLAVFLISITATVAVVGALRRGADRLVAQRADQQAEVITDAITGQARRYHEHLAQLAASLGAQAQLEASEFAAITAPLAGAVLPGVTGVAYVVAAEDAEVDRVQAYWRDRGVTGLDLRPRADGTPPHLFFVLSQAFDGIRTPAGADLSVVPEAVEALRTAREKRRVITSRPYRLLKDLNRTATDQEPGFVLAAAVYATSPAADSGSFRGWVLLGVRSGAFLRQAVSAEAGNLATVELSSLAAGARTPMAVWRPAGRIDTTLGIRERTVEIPLSTWQVTVAPTTGLTPRGKLPPDVVAGLLGTLITLLLMALTAALVTSRERALRRVANATAVLHADIRRREEVEAQLRRRTAELKGFAGIVAHDLRGPLARITGYLGFLQDDLDDTLEDQQRDYLNRAGTAAQRMSTLVDDLLGFAVADHQRIARRPVDLNRLVAELVAEGFSRPATVQADPLPTVDGDESLLRQVFANLIGNAVKYTDASREPWVHLSGGPDGDGWRVDVEDHGIGIPDRQKEAVFTAFTRADGSEDYPGTGLGLAIVHRIVERHGGTVRITDNPGGGSRFHLTFPPRSP